VARAGATAGSRLVSAAYRRVSPFSPSRRRAAEKPACTARNIDRVQDRTMPIHGVETHRIYRQIADQLATLIDAGEFPAGTRLPSERELAAALGVSRPSVREALIVLELAGKVRVRGGAGVFVSSPDSEIDELAVQDSPFELLRPRRVVEGEIAMEAAHMALPEDLVAIRAAVDEMSRCSESRADAADREFHLAIAKATHNGTLVSVAQGLWRKSRGAPWKRTERHFHSRRVRAAILRDHRAILAAIEAHDARRARAAMRRHLEQVEREFRRIWKRSA
jgi:DNA-binding FadR family transcriptional regulator